MPKSIAPDPGTTLSITGATEHNLKDISIDIPHNALITVTGLSGSGKSSLVFDTIYAEGQRRYIETFSPYTRQFLDKIKKPEIRHISGIRPTIAIQQRTRAHSTRSTVGSISNIQDYLKILWANLSTVACTSCGTPLPRWTSNRIAAHIQMAVTEKPRAITLLICAPYQVHNPNQFLEEQERLRVLGFARYFCTTKQEVVSLAESTPVFKNNNLHPIVYLVLERLRGGTQAETRIREAVDQARQLSKERCTLIELNGTQPAPLTNFDNDGNCLTCNTPHGSLPSPQPHLFSYSHPLGACPECRGFGRILEIDITKCVPDPSISIMDGALACWNGEKCAKERRSLLKFCAKEDIPTSIPWAKLSPAAKDKILNHDSRAFCGVLPWFKWLEGKTYKMHVRIFLARYRSPRVCAKCSGTRFTDGALSYRINGYRISDAWELPLKELLDFGAAILASKNTLPRDINAVAQSLISRLTFLCDLGLEYLTLSRSARTLSGGEMQRVNLATALGTELTSTHFILDEPSVGLHQRDTDRLSNVIRTLTDRGNSVTVVEHDLGVVGSGDYIIELGPGSGAKGGNLTAFVPQSSWHPPSLATTNPTRAKLQPDLKHNVLKVFGAKSRNLKGFDLEIPLQRLVAITGVSGSGKSTLINEVLARTWNASKQVVVEEDSEIAAETNQVEGFSHLADLVLVDQTPLAKSPRANIATYTDMWEHFRSAFAGTESAKGRALSRSSFSFNVDGGRCSACKGAGATREEMQFLSDVVVPCETCNGTRFSKTVLEVTLDGLNVAEVLSTPAQDCERFIGIIPKIAATITLLNQLGLGHLTLGHPLSDLSGGEAQRLKLVPYITAKNQGNSLFIFDEPTTGLHLYDIYKLLEVFRFLRDAGHTVICVEHNLALIYESDWVIDLGPEGGEQGGYLLATDTPENLAKDQTLATGKALAEWLETYKLLRATPTKKVEIANSKILPLPVQKHEKRNIEIRGARANNLKNVDLDVPLGKFLAFTGVSGSGKSTIAKDIIYAEGQRRYLDCLSPYARQFIKELAQPDVDSIKNLLPTIFVAQHTFQPGALSTVGTLSESYHYLRLLFAKTGTQYCLSHPNQPITGASPRGIAERVACIEGPVRLLAPVIKKKKGHHREVVERALAGNIHEIRVDGIFCRPGSVTEGLARNKVHSIEFTTARIAAPAVELELLEQAITDTIAISGGEIIVVTSREEILLSVTRACPICNRGYFAPDPEDFSFSSQRGQCKTCSGTGATPTGKVCSGCQGTRIAAGGRNVKINDKNIGELAQLSTSAVLDFLAEVNLTGRAAELAKPIFTDLVRRLRTLCEMGLDYLELNRSCDTLSSGEMQRLRLSAALGSPLTGVLYLFDEPSAGLHPQDNQRVLKMLRTLRDSGNSVVIIEHDPESILATDHVIDVGPGGGREGGEIICNAPQAVFRTSKSSLTAKSIDSYQSELCRSLEVKSATKVKKSITEENTLSIESYGIGNVHPLNIELPMGSLIVVGGVSGAGKSTLVNRILRDTIIHGTPTQSSSTGPAQWKHLGTKVTSTLPIARVVEVDQKPIGKNARSTPISYLKIFDEFRRLYASTLEARAAGYNTSFFSYNSGKGRCAACNGLGMLRLEMSFLADAKVLCEECVGWRYNEQARSILFAGVSIADLLRLTFSEAKELFAHHRRVHHKLRMTCELGLGYLTLGQDSSTLSGGESQRLKLVAELSTNRTGHTLYLLDEPTTGLHISDVGKLISTLKQLVTAGNTVVVIEHEEHMIANADYFIELGPEAAHNGGAITFTGTPRELLKDKTCWATILKEKFKDKQGRNSVPDNTMASGGFA